MLFVRNENLPLCRIPQAQSPRLAPIGCATLPWCRPRHSHGLARSCCVNIRQVSPGEPRGFLSCFGKVLRVESFILYKKNLFKTVG